MNKKVRENLKIRNEENLQLMKKFLPNWNWKLQRIENKEMNWDLDNKEKRQDITMFYETEQPQHIDVNGIIKIDVVDVSKDFPKSPYKNIGIKVDFRHRGQYIGGTDQNEKTIRDEKKVSNGSTFHYEKKTQKEIWEEINEFFTTYLVSLDERIEKELPTELSNKIEYLLRTYHYQYDDILLTQLFGSKNSQYPSEERKYLEEMRKDFEKVYKKERLKRGLKIYPQGYFGTTIGMIQSFLDDQVFGEFGNWYEDRLEEMKRDLDEREDV